MDEIDVFKALADPTRLKILDLVKDEEKCICDIIPFTGKSQPNVSQHLKVLRVAGLIDERKEGTKILIRSSKQSIYEVIEKVRDL
jgi:ArsR family transcriptional regulator